MTRITTAALACCSAAVASTAVLALLAGPAAAAGGSSVPFTDPNAHGYIALCSVAGNNITSGNVATAPFAWKAVSSVPTPAAFSGPGQNVALTVYQAQQGVDPAEWNGDDLTAASFFHKGSPPTAAATYKDISLATIVREFPPMWDGLYQLRLQSARTGYGADSATYPATVIQVVGSRWHVVQGGTLPCGTARATSQETFAGIPVTDPHNPSSQKSVGNAVAQRQSSSNDQPDAVLAPSNTASHVISQPLISQARTTPHQSAATAVGLGVATGCVAAFLAGGLLWRRRFSRSSSISEGTV